MGPFLLPKPVKSYFGALSLFASSLVNGCSFPLRNTFPLPSLLVKPLQIGSNFSGGQSCSCFAAA